MGHGWEGKAQEGEGGIWKLRRGGRETQTWDQGLFVISCSKCIDKFDRQTMRRMEELCATLL